MDKIGGIKWRHVGRLVSSGLWCVPFVLLVAAHLVLINRHYPLMGGDFFYLYDHLVFGNWHLAEQGLHLFYYTAYSCGGGVVYGQPDDVFYSLLQLSGYLVGFWQSINLTILVNLTLGYIGWFLVGRYVLLLDRKWSHLFVFIILTNGFYINNIIAGHWNFFTIPLIGWLVWCLFDRHDTSYRSISWRVGVLSLVSGWMIYSGNYYVYILWLMLTLLLVPVDLFIARKQLIKRTLLISARGLACGLGALAITGSKLYAVYLYMQIYPRTVDLIWTFPDHESLNHILNSFFGYLLPRYNTSFYTVHTPGFAMLLSPVVILGVLCAMWLWIRSLRKNNWNGFALLLSTAYVCLVSFGALLLISGDDNLIVRVVHGLPIFSSLRGHFRYLFALSIPIVMVAVWALYQSMNKLNKLWQAAFILGGVVVTLMTFFIYNGRTVDYYMTNDWRVRSYLEADMAHRGIRQSGGFLAPVERVITGWDNYEIGSTGMGCADGLTLWAGGSALHAKALVAGPVDEQRDGYFNMMKPACMLYPKENDCQPGDRIPVSDTENFHRFRYGMKTDWQVSLRQRALNWLSLTWLVVCVAGLLGGGVYGAVHKARSLLRKK